MFSWGPLVIMLGFCVCFCILSSVFFSSVVCFSLLFLYFTSQTFSLGFTSYFYFNIWQTNVISNSHFYTKWLIETKTHLPQLTLLTYINFTISCLHCISVVTYFLISFYSTETYTFVFVCLNFMFSDVKLHLNGVYYMLWSITILKCHENSQRSQKIQQTCFHFYRTFSALVKLGAWKFTCK